MIKKKDLLKLINSISVSIKQVEQLETPPFRVKDRLEEVILLLGKKPAIIPIMDTDNLSEEDEILDMSNVYVRRLCIGDLVKIRTMLFGIYYNYSDYKSENKILKFLKDIIKLLPFKKSA